MDIERFWNPSYMNSNRFNNTNVETSGSTLEVAITGLAFWNSWGGSRPKLEVSMPVLESLNLSGASTATAKGFASANNFQLELSGASSADIDIQAFDTSISISGASGAALDNLAVKDARTELSGASHSTVNASGTLDIYVSGASNLTYVGNPTMGTVDVTGASSIHHQ